MKRFLLMLFTLTLVGCMDDGKFDNLKAEVNTALPIGTYGITAEGLMDMLGFDAKDIVADKVIEITYDDEAYDLIGSDVISDIVKIDDQDNPATFNLSPLTDQIPAGESRDLTIDADVADIFTSDVEFAFKDGGRPTKIIFNSARLSVSANTNMPTQNMYVEFESITKNGAPLRVNVGQSVTLDDTYEMNFTEESGKQPYVTIAVQGSTTVKSNSTLAMTISLSGADVKYIEGDLERQVESSSNTFALGNMLSGLDNIEEFYPENIIFNLDIDNAFEELPMLVQVTKMTFVDKGGATKNIDIKNGLDIDRFFIKKGQNSLIIDNAISQSGKGLSDAFSKNLTDVNIEYTIIINPTDADAMGDVPQNKDNKVLVDTKISSPAHFKVPLKGYIKGMAIDTVMQVDFDIEGFDAKSIQYNIGATNGFPLDMDIELVIMDKNTDRIISNDTEPIRVNGSGALSYDAANVRTLTGEGISELFRSNANLGLRIRANTVGADNKEIVSFLGGDKLDINLFLGFNGVYSF